MDEKLEKIQKILEVFKEIHLKNSSEYKKGSQKYRKLTPTGEWNEEHNSSFVEMQKILAEIVKDDEEKSFIIYLSDSFIFGPGDIGREDLSWNKYVDIVKKSPNYLKYFEDLKKGDTEVKGSYQVVFEQDKLNAFCSSIISEVMAKNKNNSNFLISQKDKKESEGLLIVRKNGDKVIEDLNDKEITIKIEKYCNLRIKEFKFIKNGITIIVGENNVGKTNLLNYIYEKGDDWNGFNNDFHEINEDGTETLYYRRLPLFFGNDKLIFSTYAKGNIKRWDTDYFYKLYYLDLKTFFNFLEKEVEEDEAPRKIKIEGCYLRYIEEVGEKGKLSRDAFLWGGKIAEQEKSWKIKYSGKVVDITTYRNKETGAITHGAFHESTNKYLDISKLGSGHLKIERIKALVNFLKSDNLEVYEDKVYVPILLIDEPELLLHPSMVVEVSKLIKGLKENNITTIFTTHSPFLLSQFVYEEEVAVVVAKSDIIKKDLLGELMYFWDIVRKIKEEIEGMWKNYCDCLKSKIESDDKFYYDYWKGLLNEYTLKIFFAKKVIFVEGPSDYILLTSEFLRKEIPGLSEVEVVPIFGKSNYIFFDRLAGNMRVKRWTLLDIDTIRGVSQNNGEEKSECDGSKLNDKFWELHRGKLEREKIKNDEINHAFENRISWFPGNIEKFLLPKGNDDWFWAKRHWWTSKEARMIGNISSNGFVGGKTWGVEKRIKEDHRRMNGR